MSKIAVDFHDVTCDLVGGFVKAYNKKHKKSVTVEDINDWDWSKTLGPNGRQLFFDLFTPELQFNLNSVRGAWSAAHDLYALKHTIVYATATYGPMADAAYKWLKDWGFIGTNEGYERFMTVADKSLIRADFLVDDKPENVEAFTKAGNGVSILFDRPWNRKFKWLRANNWDEVVSIIDQYSTKQWDNIYKTQITHKQMDGETVIVGLGHRDGSREEAQIWVNGGSQLHSVKTPAEQIAKLLSGVGPDVAATSNEKGGKQSALPYRFDLVDPTVMFVLAQILAEGAEKYGEWNWRKLDLNSNLNHALSHIYAALAGDEQDDHLGHALCRLLFAKSIQHNPDPKNLMAWEDKK